MSLHWAPVPQVPYDADHLWTRTWPPEAWASHLTLSLNTPENVMNPACTFPAITPPVFLESDPPVARSSTKQGLQLTLLVAVALTLYQPIDTLPQTITHIIMSVTSFRAEVPGAQCLGFFLFPSVFLPLGSPGLR